MKKVLSIVVMMTMVFTLVLTGCGEKKTDTVDSGTQVNDDNGSNADSQEDINDTEDTDSEDEQEDVADKALKVSMVTDTGGINDQSFNQLAWAGLEKAQKDLGITAEFLESTQEADYAPNLETLYDQDNDLIWGIGYLMADAVLDAAKTNPDRKYAIIDNAYTEEQEAPDNLLGVTFSEQEPSFLVGYIAGKMTKTNNVGFVGGMEFDVIWRFESGYRAGVKTANPDAEIQIQYVNDFGDTAKGKAIANGMYQNGADIIFHAAGFSGTGVIESAVENGKLVIGVDQDQKVILGKDEIITSAVKKVDQAIYNVVKELQEGKWEGGSNINLGLADGAVGIADTSVDSVPQDILDEVKQLEQDIIDKKITVPATREEYDELYSE
ncbi:BMP family ABC transporter substrate-binding protein [Vallitalea longa]|uniref:BMP family ABC transporter substrate-binding protein n=1 Tax=Vallitalea longa TaxID=2936439 RepID=A0A9W5YC03_9FIRM|nr:BMP family ABC transporter substrate-binding protein [Vallitalea longa]GKX30329.1 BMP family ABC transporter substrate-binding protein [Vallitalea longa]